MRLSARVDYALRAVVELAASSLPGGRCAAGTPTRSGAHDEPGPGEPTSVAGAAPGTPPRPVPAERLAHAQEIPPKFLESILLQLRRGGIVTAQRGPEGGYRLARPADEISLAEVIRVIDGPLANVRGQRPEDLGYKGPAEALQDVWIALRASEREILELVTLAQVATGELPPRVRELIADPRAWT